MRQQWHNANSNKLIGALFQIFTLNRVKNLLSLSVRSWLADAARRCPSRCRIIQLPCILIALNTLSWRSAWKSELLLTDFARCGTGVYGRMRHGAAWLVTASAALQRSGLNTRAQCSATLRGAAMRTVLWAANLSRRFSQRSRVDVFRSLFVIYLWLYEST